MSNTLKNYKTMKRLLTIGLVLASAFALTNCTEQLVAPVEENDVTVDQIIDSGVQSEVVETIPYEVSVENAETKTAYDSDKGYISWIKNTDKIVLYNKKSTDGATTYSRHGAFTYAGGGRFAGDLVNPSTSLADLNNWYCIYPFNSSSAGTNGGKTIQETVTIGAIASTDVATKGKYIQSQEDVDVQRHLAGERYPLYGIKNKVPKDESPKFRMSHLYSVVALKIVNETEGDIVVKYAEFKANEDIVGDFKVDICGDEPVFTSQTGKTSSIARVQLGAPTKIAKNGSATLYLAIKPFDASNDDIVISINGTARTGNGASRTVKMPANVKFDAGKVTTLKVPVKTFSFHNENVNPATNNVMTGIQATTMKKSWGIWYTEKGNAISVSGSSKTKMTINGKETETYILGTDSSTGSITVRGTAKELFPYIPIEFYASSWDNKQAVMRVEKVTAYFWLVVYIPISFTYDELAGKLMSADRIKFSGLVPAEQYSVNSNNYITILDEEPYHKQVSQAQIENLLQNFDDYDDGFDITYQGLYDAITNPSSIKSGDYTLEQAKTPADITAYIIYHKIFDVLHSPANAESLGKLAGVAELIFSNPKRLFETVATMPIEATLSTVAAGNDGATDNRLVIWGFNSPNVK